jgi:hypothetical protein
MANTIRIRRSSVASAVPTTTQLALGELAINTNDGKLFLKRDNGTQSIVEVGAGGGGGSGDVVAANNNAFTGANTFTNTTGQTFRQAATQDGILLRGRAGGTGSFDVSLTTATLSADQTLTFPNVTGTVVTTGDTGSVTGTMIANNTVTNAKIAPTSAAVNGESRVLVTNTAGTATEWSSSLTLDNISLGGNLGSFTGNGWSLIFPDGSGGVISWGQTGVGNDFYGSCAFRNGASVPSGQALNCQGAPGILLSGTVSPTATVTQGLLAQGTLGFSAARVGANFQSSQTSYYQVLLQNTSNNAAASCDFVVCNNASTDSTNYGNFGINSSTFSGTGALNAPSAVYVTGTSGPMVVGTTTANDIRFVYNSEATDSLTIGATEVTFGKTLRPRTGTATAGTAPIDFAAGTNLTVAEAGTLEYDGAYFYATPTTTSGRGHSGVFQTFRLTANGGAIGPAIADYFGATSSINLAASSVYEIEFFAYFQKNTAGTLTWTHTASSAPTLITSLHRAGPITGIAAGTPTTLYTGSRGATTAAFGATGSISNNAFMAYEFHTRVITNLATTFKLQVTSSAGTVTPQAGSFYTVRQVSGTTGSFA